MRQELRWNRGGCSWCFCIRLACASGRCCSRRGRCWLCRGGRSRSRGCCRRRYIKRCRRRSRILLRRRCWRLGEPRLRHDQRAQKAQAGGAQRELKRRRAALTHTRHDSKSSPLSPAACQATESRLIFCFGLGLGRGALGPATDRDPRPCQRERGRGFHSTEKIARLARFRVFIFSRNYSFFPEALVAVLEALVAVLWVNRLRKAVGRDIRRSQFQAGRQTDRFQHASRIGSSRRASTACRKA